MDLRSTAIFALALTIPAISGSLAAQTAEPGGEWFKKPIRIVDAKGPIDVEIGHAAPFMADLDKDGKDDLLVGQFGSGRLRIYKNVGTQAKPEFEGFDWMMAEKEIGSVPSG